MIILEYFYLSPFSPPVCRVHFAVEAFRSRTAVEETLRGVNGMLGVDWLPHQPSHGFDDVLTLVCDKALGIVIPSHILESV